LYRSKSANWSLLCAKDAPAGAPENLKLVQNVKGGNVCTTCGYVKRGSFGELSVPKLAEEMDKKQSMRDKSDS
jgi:hypothetical protein